MNQEAIERVAKVLHDQFMAEQGISNPRYDLSVAKEVYRENARAVLAAIHPTVSSVEELDALPVGSVIRFIDITPTVAVKDDEGTWCGSHGLNYYGWYDDDPSPVPFPATVLHIGGAA